MKMYSSPSGRKTKELCKKLNIGVMIVEHYYDMTDYPYFAVDNGCFSAYNRGVEWDPKTFLDMLNKYTEKGQIPDFAVIPDIVAGGLKSLAFSMEWIGKLKKSYPQVPLYLAVQDGMAIEDIDGILDATDNIAGLFVGGTMHWKMATMGQWASYGHSKGLKVHAGRIGPVDRMVKAHDCGIDSIDSTTWVQCQCLEHHVKKYRNKANSERDMIKPYLRVKQGIAYYEGEKKE